MTEEGLGVERQVIRGEGDLGASQSKGRLPAGIARRRDMLRRIVMRGKDAWRMMMGER